MMKQRRVIAAATCQRCGSTHSVKVERGDWFRYVDGELVQNVWPEFSLNLRETLRGARAGYYFCPPCFDVTHFDPDIELQDA